MNITKKSDSILVVFFKLFLCSSAFVACILFGFWLSPMQVPSLIVIFISLAITVLFTYWIFGIGKLKHK